MQKLIVALCLMFVSIYISNTVRASGFEFVLTNPQTTVTCNRGDQNCKYESVVHIYNRTDRTLYEPIMWTEGLPRNTVRYMLNGAWVEGRNIVKESTAPNEETINTLVSIQAPNETGIGYGYLYIDGKACNQTNPPRDCTYYAGTGITIAFNIVDPPTNTPTTTPSPSPEPPTNTPTPTPTVTSTQNYWVSFTPQGVPSADWDTAEELLTKLQSLGQQAKEVSRWVNGGWDSHIFQLPFNNFSLTTGTGYLINYSHPSNFDFNSLGTSGNANNQYTFYPGWNFFGFPRSVLSYQINAENFCSMLITQGVRVKEIQDWTDNASGQAWIGHTCGTNTQDFTILNRKAYFIRSESMGVFTVPVPTIAVSPTPSRTPTPVKSQNNSSQSSTSTNNSSGGTPPKPCEYKAPASAPYLQKIVTGKNFAKLIWSEAKDPVTYYLVAYGLAPNAFMYGNPNVGHRGTISFTIDNLAGNKKYCFVVRAGNECMPGEFSNIKCVTISGDDISGKTIAAGFTTTVLSSSTEARMRKILNSVGDASSPKTKIPSKKSGIYILFDNIYRAFINLF